MLFVFFFFGFFNAMYEMIKSCQYTDTSDQIQNNVWVTTKKCKPVHIIFI